MVLGMIAATGTGPLVRLNCKNKRNCIEIRDIEETYFFLICELQLIN